MSKQFIYKSFLDDDTDTVISVYYDVASNLYEFKIGLTTIILSGFRNEAKDRLRVIRDHLSAALIDYDRDISND